jgi:thiol-disulfide isomerase/thioredoxin
MPPIKGQSSGRFRPLLWILLLAAVAVASYLFFREEEKKPSDAPMVSLLPADVNGKAPAFVLQALDGRQVSLSDFKGKVVILDFWASWCGPCKAEIPDFIALQREYGGSGLQIVGVALDDEAPVRAYATNAGMNYPILFGDDRVSAAFGGIPAIPTTFVIDGSGRIIAKYVGFRDKSIFEAHIRKLLAV